MASARIRAVRQNQRILCAMLAILHLLGTFVVNLFRSRHRLEVESLFLRHQLNIALRRAPHRLPLHGSDRALMVWMIRVWPSLLDLSSVVQPDTIRRVSGLLALEISRSTGQAQNRTGAARTHPTDEQGEPPVGRAAHPW
jgi:hypothetical protein